MIEHEPDQTIFERRDPLIGNTLDDRFRIDARLATGGFGSIYRAEDLRSGRDVALKVLHANLAGNPLLVARFRREAETLASLRDPHTVTAYEFGEAEDGTLYIAMELLHGETLYDAFRKQGGPLPWRRVVAIARAVCSSLAEAHRRGIVHRDLKPANIHLQERDGQRDFVKVLDFGIAKILHGSELESSELTIAGQMIGTFDYMAPEQMLGGVVGAPCDLYTLGVVMYETIGGRLPYADAANPTQLLAMLLTTEPPTLAELTAVPPELDRIVMRCLAREQQDRYQSAEELAAALDRVLAGGAHAEATRTAAARPLDDDGPTRIGHRAAESRAASARRTPAGGTPRRAAAAHALAPPIEPSGDVRAQGSQPVIAPVGRAAQSSQLAIAPACRVAHPASVPSAREGRGAQPPMAAFGADRGPQPYAAAPPAYPQHVDPRAGCYPGAEAAHAPFAAMPASGVRRAQPAPEWIGGSQPYVDPRTPHPVADARGSQPYIDPRVPYSDADARGSQPYVDPRVPYLVADARGSQPYVDPHGGQLAPGLGPGWQPQPPARRRPEGVVFDAARDAAVGRVVWLLVLVLGFVLAAVVAKLL